MDVDDPRRVLRVEQGLHPVTLRAPHVRLTSQRDDALPRLGQPRAGGTSTCATDDKEFFLCVLFPPPPPPTAIISLTHMINRVMVIVAPSLVTKRTTKTTLLVVLTRHEGFALLLGTLLCGASSLTLRSTDTKQ